MQRRYATSLVGPYFLFAAILLLKLGIFVIFNACDNRFNSTCKLIYGLYIVAAISAVLVKFMAPKQAHTSSGGRGRVIAFLVIKSFTGTLTFYMLSTILSMTSDFFHTTKFFNLFGSNIASCLVLTQLQ